MKAIVYTKYGPPEVLELKELEKPSPNENEVLVKVHSASVNPLDFHFMRGTPFFIRLMTGLRKPNIPRLGVDLSGTVEAVGRNVTQFKAGDEVWGNCKGSFSEFVCTREDKLALKPSNISFEQAAAVPVAAITALQGLRDHGRIRSGQRVLIDGASGGVGTFAVQIAKSFGAEVTAVCSTGNLNTMKSIGADHVIDYTKKNFTENGERYDLIFAANAFHSIFDYKRSLNSIGIYVMIGGGGAQMIQTTLLGPWLSMTGKKKMGGMLAKIIKRDLVFLNDLLETGKVVPVIDKRYPLSETSEAIRYLEEGHARGKVIITIETQ